MIKQVLRQDIFRSKKFITSIINEFQGDMKDWQNFEFESDEDKEDYNSLFDILEIPFEKFSYHHKPIGFDHDDLSTFTSILSEKIITLLTTLDISELYIVSHFKMELLGARKNKYKPLKDSVARFEKLAGIPNTNESFEVDLEDLPQCIETFFWIERCDPSGPEYLFFCDKQDRFAFYLCKDGNVHTLSSEANYLNDDLLLSQGWQVIKGKCYDLFTDDGAIEGRKLSFEHPSNFIFHAFSEKIANVKRFFSRLSNK